LLLVNPPTGVMLINVFFGGGEISPFFNKEISNMFVFKKSPKFEYQEKKKQTLMLMSSSKTTVVNSDFFAGEVWPNFGLKIYDFHLYKGFIMGKIGTNSPDFNPKRKSKLPNFMLSSSRYPSI
jgi:hypothetical protein